MYDYNSLYHCKNWLILKNQYTNTMDINQQKKYEGGVYHMRDSFSILKYEKERKGNFSNKSISFITTPVYWNIALLRLIFLLLTVWNRQVIIQLNHMRNRFKGTTSKSTRKKWMLCQFKITGSLTIFLLSFSLSFLEKLNTFCVELHINYVSGIINTF